MGKGYYIVGAVLLGVGAYLIYSKIKNGNLTYNSKNQDIVVQAEEGSHLNPPMQVPPLATPPLVTPPIV